MNIITIDEKNQIYDAMYYAKKPFNNQKLTEEERLEACRNELMKAVAICDKIKVRWAADKIFEKNRKAMDALSKM
jgi:hypothetical protein